MEKVGIVGYYQVKPDSDIQMSRYEMVFNACRGALDSAGLKRDNITTVISASNDYYAGKTISNAFTVEAGASYLKDESKVEMDGAHAAYYALWRCLSGNHKLALVWADSQPSTFHYSSARLLEAEPTWERPFELLNDRSAAALGTRAYMEIFRSSIEDIANVAAKAHSNAANNPLALEESKIANCTVDQVLGSDLLCDPITELMHAVPCDGATALIMAPEDMALKITDNPVWITGVGLAQETYFLGDRDLSVSVSMEQATKAAYKKAGIQNPKSEINVAEIFEHSAYEQLVLTEAAGLAEKGKAASDLDGGVPINPSGGALGAFTPCACGLTRLVEAAKQIRGEAEGHQISGVNKALAHGQIGFAAQNNIVYVLEGGKK